MNEELAIQVVVVAAILATIAGVIFAVVKILTAASIQHDAQRSRQERAQERLQAEAEARRLTVRSVTPEDASPTLHRIAEGRLLGVKVQLEQGWRVIHRTGHALPLARVTAELGPSSAGVLQISLETTLTHARTELLGPSDLQCGAADLDTRYRFHSAQPERATALLQSPALQENLRTLTHLPGFWELSVAETTASLTSVSERMPEFGLVAEALVRFVRALDGTAHGRHIYRD